MTDDQLDDAALDDQIRAGVRALADEAPTPPDLMSDRPGPEPATVHQLGHPLTLVAAAAAIVLLVAGAAIVVTRTDDTTTVQANSTTTGPATTTTVPDRSLYGVRWVAESAVVEGQETTFPSEESGTPTIVFDDAFDCNAGEGGSCMTPDGPAFFFYDGCNSGSGGMEIEGNTIRVSQMGSTAMGCGRWYSPFRRGNENPEGVTTFEIIGDRLIMSGPDGSAFTYRAGDDPLPERDGEVLIEDRVADVVYRITWQAIDDDYSMYLDRGIGGRADASVELSANDDVPAFLPQKAQIWGNALVYGMVPSAAATLTYVPSKTDPVDIPLLPLDGGAFQAFATLVPSGDQDWTLTATDADGNEIASYTAGTSD